MKKKEYDVLPEIKNGTRPKVLLVGNGINRSFENPSDTEDIIRKQWEKQYNENLPGKKNNEYKHPIWNLPFTMQVVVASKDHVQNCMTELAESFKQIEISEKQTCFIKEILNARFDAVLTTNYSLEFEKSIIEKFSERKIYNHYKTTKDQSTRQRELGIFQCTELPDDNHTLLWHIHGTALRKKSIVMGQAYYGKLLTEVVSQANVINVKYRNANKQQSSIHPESWIDYFLIGDLYIVGFSLDYLETDIWWLLSYKKSAFPQSKTYFYSPYLKEEQKMVFRCYDVELPRIDFNDEKSDRYIEYYKKALSSINASRMCPK